MATVSLLLCMVVAAQLLSYACLGQQCACGSTTSNDFDFRNCVDEEVLLEKISRSNSVVCQQYNTQRYDGFEDCFFQSPENTTVTSLQDLTDFQNGYNVTRLFSPNHQTGSCCYPSQMFCGYNLQCQPGEILFYHIVRSDIQNKTNELCNDHLSILRDSHSSREVITCGKDTSLQWEENDSSAPSSGTEFERLQVKFYSSRGCHNCGFFMFAFCINEAEKYNQPKCVTSMPNIGKRDTSSKDSKMNNPLAGYHRHRRVSFKTRPIAVAVETTMTYRKNTLRILHNNRLLREFHGIRLLMVYDTVFKYEFNYGSSKLTYNGYGILHIGTGIAQYYQVGVSPELEPTRRENDVIATILRELVQIDLRLRDDRLEFRGLTTKRTTTPTPTNSPGGPKGAPRTFRAIMTDPDALGGASEFCPTKGANTCLFTGKKVGKRSTTAAEFAKEAARSCNGIIRSVGQYFIARSAAIGRS